MSTVGERRPDLLFVGPMRAGTTWVHQYLESRGDVCLPQGVKETFFFDRQWSQGVDWYRWHFAHFSAAIHRRAIEVAPSYFHCPRAANRIRDTLGRVQIVIMLRDPIERSWSHFLHLRRYGLVKDDIREAVRDYPEIIGASRYGQHVERWSRTFGDDRVSLLRFDHLASDAAGFARELDACLGLPTRADSCALPSKTNVSVAAPRSKRVAMAGRRVAGALRGRRLYGLVNMAKRLGLKRLFYGGGEGSPPRLSDADSNWLAEALGEDAFRFHGEPKERAVAE